MGKAKKQTLCFDDCHFKLKVYFLISYQDYKTMKCICFFRLMLPKFIQAGKMETDKQEVIELWRKIN